MKNNDETQALLNEVKAQICAAVIRKNDLSLGTIGEIASLLGLEAVVKIAVSNVSTRSKQKSRNPQTKTKSNS